MGKLNIAIIFVFLAGCLYFPHASETLPAAPAYGYQLTLESNSGITQTYGTGQVVPAPADTSQQAKALGAGDALRQREGHRNDHGQHGAPLDRGQSPHAH